MIRLRFTYAQMLRAPRAAARTFERGRPRRYSGLRACDVCAFGRVSPHFLYSDTFGFKASVAAMLNL